MPTRKWKMTGSYLLHNDLHYNGLVTDWGLAFRCSYFVVVLEIWDDMLYGLSPWKKRWSVLRVSLWRLYKYIPCHCRKVRKKRGKATKNFRSFGNCYLEIANVVVNDDLEIVLNSTYGGWEKLVRVLAGVWVGVCLFSLAYAHAGVRCARVPLRVVFFCCHICHMSRDEWEQRGWEMRLTKCPLNQ